MLSEITPESVQATLDNIWILIAAVLVIFMQAGFALVEAGLTRGKNVANIFMKNLMDFCVGALLFFAVGYAIAFGGSMTGLGRYVGGDGWFLAGDGIFTYGTLDKFVFFTFQVAFAATAAKAAFLAAAGLARSTRGSAVRIGPIAETVVALAAVMRAAAGAAGAEDKVKLCLFEKSHVCSFRLVCAFVC